MTNTNQTTMTCKTKFAFENDAIPMFYIDLCNREIERGAIVVLTVADAFDILKAWHENNRVAVFRGGYKDLCSICWYDDPVDNMAFSVGNFDGERGTFWLNKNYCTQLIESLQSYVYKCATLVGGH